MSYEKKTRSGKYLSMGADDPWAAAGGGAPATTPTTDSGGALSALFSGLTNVGGSVANVAGSAGGGVVAAGTQPGATAPKTSTVTDIGAGIGAFLKGLGTPVAQPPGMPMVPYKPAGMSNTTKLALAGGGALLLVLLLTRD